MVGMDVRELIMNRSTPLFLLLSFLCATAFAEIPQADRQFRQNQPRHGQQMAQLAPSLRGWVIQEGRVLAKSQADLEVDGFRQVVRTRLAGQDFSEMDIEALVQLLAMETARQADEDLREVMAEMQARNDAKKAMRESSQASRELQMQARQEAAGMQSAKAPAKDLAATDTAAREVAVVEADPAAQLDSLSGLGETEQLRMQMAMDRRAKAMETLSNLLKKSSDTASTITANLK